MMNGILTADVESLSVTSQTSCTSLSQEVALMVSSFIKHLNGSKHGYR